MLRMVSYPHRPQSGHFTCYLNRTYHVLPTLWYVTDCSGQVICVTSLNMRKWMRDRIQRRKKKAPEQGDQAAPPPLQPAYFDADQAASPEHESSHSKSNSREEENAAVAEPELEAQPAREERKAADMDTADQGPQPAASTDSQRGRGRRRRGGRGRGGRGREQAVAQAFTPAVAKGIIPDVPVEGEEAQPEQIPADVAEAEVAPQAPAIPAVPAAPARPPKGIVVLAIGLPGSGKSSWFKRHNVAPLSSDMVRHGAC